MKRLLFSAGCCLFFCVNLFAQKMFDNSKEIKLKDVAYGSFPSSKMDIFLPANRNEQTPFVIVIHGGAWIFGDKSWDTRTQGTLLAHGIASANIDYRYADDDSVHYRQLLSDVDSAFLYCINHAEEWHTRKNKFVVNGTSAGAHLALMYGYTAPKERIAAVVSECGPTDFTDTAVLNYYYHHPDTVLIHALYKIAGASYKPGQAVPQAFINVSPVTHIKNIPTLLFHGTADKTVIYSQALSLRDKLKKKNYTCKLVTLPGQDHDLGINDPKYNALIYKEFVDWVLRYGK